jgi:hypothetical protein
MEKVQTIANNRVKYSKAEKCRHAMYKTKLNGNKERKMTLRNVAMKVEYRQSVET